MEAKRVRLALTAACLVAFGSGARAGEDTSATAALASRGITLGVNEQFEIWGGLSGGRRRGVTANGLLTLSADIDLGKALGLDGWRFYTSLFQIHGRGPSQELVGNLQTISNIEATRANKLYNIWVQKTFFGDRLEVRAGQEGANDEMMISRQAQLFLNSSFGFPALLASDLPSGGPNYPIAAPMIRSVFKLSQHISVMAAVFNGDPAGPGPGDPQLRDRFGTAFRVNDAPLAFAEIWFSPDGGGATAESQSLWKVGVWRHQGRFADQRNGLPAGQLPAFSQNYRGNYAFYAIADQTIWQRPDAQGQSLGIWALVMGAPQDRNLINLFIEGGLTLKSPFESRPADTAGLAFSYMKISNSARIDTNFPPAGGVARPAPFELVTELTYLFKYSTNVSVQPSLQYVVNPGARLPSAANRQSSGKLHNAVVLGVRSTVSF